MKALGWLGLLAAGVILYGIGHRDGRFSVEEEQRATRRQQIQDSAFAWKVLHLRTSKASTASAHERAVIHQAIMTDTAAADTIGLRVAMLEDSVRAVPLAGDSLRFFVQIAFQQRLEIGKLRSALDGYARGYQLLERDRNQWKELADQAQPVIVGLQAAIDREVAAHRCRIVGLLPCPSRKIAIVGGFILGAGATLTLTH